MHREIRGIVAISLAPILAMFFSCGALLAQETPFVSRDIASISRAGLKFPSDNYKSCRIGAAADLKKIFFCTKKEWIEATNNIIENAQRISKKIVKINREYDITSKEYDAILPEYFSSDAELLLSDSGSDLFDSGFMVNEATLQKSSLQLASYKDDGSFDWQIFDYTEKTIKTSIDKLAELDERLSGYEQASARYRQTVRRLQFPRVVLINFSPAPSARESEFFSGKSSLSLDIGERLAIERAYIITELRLSVAADNPTPITLRLITKKKNGAAIGEPIKVDIVSNRVGGTLSRYTNTAWNELRHKYREIEFQSVDQRILRRLNSPEWDGRLDVTILKNNSALGQETVGSIAKARVHRLVLELEYLPMR